MAEAHTHEIGWPAPFTVGERFTRVLLFDRESVKQYATLSLDPNPIHLDEAMAARSRFGRLIASGTHSTGWMSGMLGVFVGERSPSLGLELNFTLRRAVPADQEATVMWEVQSLEAKPTLRGHVMQLAGTLCDPAGVLMVSATAKVLLLRDFTAAAG